MITPEQIRIARTILGWTQQELSREAEMSWPTINRIEKGTTVRSFTMSKLETIFKHNGIVFIDNKHVSMVGKVK